MAWTSKKVFKVTTFPTYTGVWIYEPGEPAVPPPEPGVSPGIVDGIQEQIDDIVDSIEGKYTSGFVFDQWQVMTTSAPFYFYWEIPLGTVEIISASVSFEVKTGTGTINFTISEDKGILYGANYGPYTTDMRAIDITGDLTGQGIKIIKLTTSANVTLTARVFLRIKISKKETPEESIVGGDSVNNERPIVRTLAATSITSVSATLNGDIISVGKGSYVDRTTGNIVPVTCTKRGFKYGLTRTDTWDTSESATYIKGKYGIGITGLTSATDYYFRAYAENQVGRSYGEYMKMTVLPTYLYCASGYPVSAVWKIEKSDMSLVAESDNYGEETYDYAKIYGIASIGNYIYIAGHNYPEFTVWKIDKSDMSKSAESDDYDATIYALTTLGDYVYCGGGGEKKVWKIDVSDMSKTAESIAYGGSIYALTNDGTYIYCAGVTTQKVWKIRISDMAKIDESANYGATIQDIVTDGTYIYCAGGTGGAYKVWKIQISDMSKVAESATYGYTIHSLTVLGDYVYCGGVRSYNKVWKMQKSDMVKVDESDVYGGSINALTNDGTYVYCAGDTTDKVWKIDPSDMSKVDEIDYGTDIEAIVVE